MERMAEKSAHFIDAMREQLIQKVSTVMPLADKLLQKNYISRETYADIRAGKTSHDKMRELFDSLSSESSKAELYEALKEQDRYLVQELEEKNKRSEAISNLGHSQGISGNAASGSRFLQVNREVQRSPSGPSSAGSSRVMPSPDPLAQHGSQRVDTEALKKQWHKNSKKYESKFEDLLKDPELRSLGNGNFFVCTKMKYKLGDGAEGTCVYIGIREDGTELAVKRMLKDNHNHLRNEMKLLRELEHKNIVKYLDYTQDEDFNYLCLQLCDYNFEDYKSTKEPNRDALKKVSKQVLLGLQTLHDAGIIHRDLKPNNILIDAEGNVRLADFGISRVLNQDKSTVKTSRVGTRGWEATEILTCRDADGMCGYKTSSDIQVAGMLVHYILSGGRHPFGKYSEVEANIAKGNYQLDERTDVEAKDLIKKMIAFEPQDRLSAKEAVEHPYFWDDDGRDAFLRLIGDMEPVQKYRDADAELHEAVRKYTKFSGWKSKITDLQPRERNIPDDLLGLLRFVRNRLVHERTSFYNNNMYKDLFPEFYISANQLAKDMQWK